MTRALFQPIQLRDVTLDNRIVVSPMCQYSATDGTMSDWHTMHLGQFAIAGAGLIVVEATGVEPEGRISLGCTGLYSDANEQAMKRVIDFCKAHGSSKIGIQLSHAGRKGSTSLPWAAKQGAVPLSEGGLTPFAPSPVPFNDKYPMPQGLDDAGLARVKQAFVGATERAARAGFDLIEIHGSHGYLIH